MADILSRFPFNGNIETTQKVPSQKVIVIESNDTKEIPEVNLPMN